MSKYIYDDSPVNPGDVVEFLGLGHYNGQYDKGKVYLVKSIKDKSLFTSLDDRGGTNNGMSKRFFKKIKTYPGKHALECDLIISVTAAVMEGITTPADTVAPGQVKVCQRDASCGYMYWSSIYPNQFNNNPNLWLTIATVNNINNEKE